MSFILHVTRLSDFGSLKKSKKSGRSPHDGSGDVHTSRLRSSEEEEEEEEEEGNTPLYFEE